MFEAWQGQVGMDFVRDNQNVVAFADVEHAVQLILGPDASAGIVGAAKDEHLAIVGGFGFKIIEIDFETSVDKREFIDKEFPVVVLGNEHERRINRCLNQNVVAWLGKALYGECHARNDAGNETKFLFLHGPGVPFLKPILNGRVPTILHDRVTQHLMFTAFAYGIHYEIRSGEVHVGYPER